MSVFDSQRHDGSDMDGALLHIAELCHGIAYDPVRNCEIVMPGRAYVYRACVQRFGADIADDCAQNVALYCLDNLHRCDGTIESAESLIRSGLMCATAYGFPVFADQSDRALLERYGKAQSQREIDTAVQAIKRRGHKIDAALFRADLDAWNNRGIIPPWAFAWVDAPELSYRDKVDICFAVSDQSPTIRSAVHMAIDGASKSDIERSVGVGALQGAYHIINSILAE